VLNKPTFYITTNPWVHGMVCALGVVFLTLGYGGWSWAKHWREHGMRTVVIIAESQNGEGIYRYQAAGRTIEKPIYETIEGRSVPSQFKGYGAGMSLVAFYDPKDPDHGGLVLERKIGGFQMGVPIFLSFGSVCLLGGMAGFAVTFRQTDKSRSR